ncbi:hypothetical protein [Prosthecodimorpha staleyi]|uniref:Uncharacterized protein n=1 Tax=Prosthecodimorpha staleyi TaxID=2840188 RepID=A0A947GBY8_9HYPH|nr:hypothetical protein [Prosthecodimorpha staleyi]MBT9289187.1 hypothetical protein [Prosthecodimorpha staleyi]
MVKLPALILAVYAAGAPLPASLVPEPLSGGLREFHQTINAGVSEALHAFVARDVFGLARIGMPARRG